MLRTTKTDFHWKAFAVVVAAMLTLPFCKTSVYAGTGVSSLDAKITAKVSTTSVQIAEPFQFEIEIAAPVGSKVSFPVVGETLSNFFVNDSKDLFDIPTEKEGVRRWNRTFTLESIESGELEIQSVQVQVSRDGKTESLQSNPLTINVVSSIEPQADPMKFRDIHSVVDSQIAASTSYAWVWWTLGGTAGFALALCGVIAFAKQKTWMTPAQWAEEELEELNRNTATGNTESQSASQELSSILREYLQLQFEISAPVQTSSELIATLKSERAVDDDLASKYEELFALADQAKFAGLSLSQTEITELLGDSRRLVEATSQLVENQPVNTGQPERVSKQEEVA